MSTATFRVRSQYRLPVQCTVVVSTADLQGAGTLWNLSFDGCRMAGPVCPRVGPELIQAQLRAGDVLLLCSDGLTGPLTDEAILALMLRYQDPLRCCRALTEAACAAGGPDNVTVAIARFSGDGLELPQGREEVALQRVQHAI